MEEDKWIKYVFISAGMKFRNKKKFRCGIPAYTGPYRALDLIIYVLCCLLAHVVEK
jgi:hypothetical protein